MHLAHLLYPLPQILRYALSSLIFKAAWKINQLAWCCQHVSKDKLLAVATQVCSGNTILRVSVFLFDILQQHKKQLPWSIFHQTLQPEHILQLFCSYWGVGFGFLREVPFCCDCSVTVSFCLRCNISPSLLHSTARWQPSLELSTSSAVTRHMWGAEPSDGVCPAAATRNFSSFLLQGILGWVRVTTSPIPINIFLRIQKMGSHLEIVEMSAGQWFLQRCLLVPQQPCGHRHVCTLTACWVCLVASFLPNDDGLLTKSLLGRNVWNVSQKLQLLQRYQDPKVTQVKHKPLGQPGQVSRILWGWFEERGTPSWTYREVGHIFCPAPCAWLLSVTQGGCKQERGAALGRTWTLQLMPVLRTAMYSFLQGCIWSGN